ncbi:MAG TPA: hypothetical protein PK470_06885, partial [Candidatus Omnitrophota bacterium]|nr:hypothetical protein [Candidatus Omnitrophota bacterium]
IERPYFNIDLSLYFIPYVNQKIARRKLKARLFFLHRIKKGLEKFLDRKNVLTSPHLKIILEHDLDLVEAEIKSFKRLIETLNRA